MKNSDQIIFQEKQSFSRLWLVLFLLIIPIGMYVKFQNEEFQYASLIAPLSVIAVLCAMFVFSKLETVICQNEIQYRLFPFHLSMRMISKDNIAEVFVRKYSPLIEYGGWGLRWGLGGKAINMRGNMGIQVVLKNGSRILIGTSKPEDAKQALKDFSATPGT